MEARILLTCVPRGASRLQCDHVKKNQRGRHQGKI